MSFAESNGVVHAPPMQNIGSSDGGAAPAPYYPILPPLSSSSPPTTTMETYQVSPAAGAAVPIPLSFPVDPMVSMDLTSIEPAKRKRGRPRKYAPDGAANSGMMSPPPLSAAQVAAQSGGGFSPTEGVEGASFAKKKGRGRPPGSGKKQQLGDLGNNGYIYLRVYIILLLLPFLYFISDNSLGFLRFQLFVGIADISDMNII